MAATSLEGSYNGLAPFKYPAAGKPLQTWYRIFGDLKSEKSPLICIHGGPGFCHNYLLNHRELADTHSIPVILYDQIGSGLSTRLPETAATPELWTEEIFFEQLKQLLTHLGIEKRYDILGSSWGGMMGSAFSATRPDGLRRLILSNAPASKQASILNRKKYRKQLPQAMQGVLERAAADGVWSSEEVSVVMQEFTRRHICKVEPFPEDGMASIRMSNEDKTVAISTGDENDGNSFVSSGYMANWTMVGRAKNITVPTLLINGIDELASGDATTPFLLEIPDVRLVTIPGTTHSPHLERKEEYYKIVAGFLNSS